MMDTNEPERNEEFVDPSGCHWGNAEDFLQGYVLGFCCCGLPLDNLKYIASILQHVHNLKEQVWSKKKTYDEWHKEGKLLGTDQQLYFAYYFLDSKKLIEHGGSVPGWLTPEGLKFLNDVNKLLDDNNEIG